MLTIQIQDEALSRRLQQIAAQENRPLEAVLKTLVAQYPADAEPVTWSSDPDEGVKQVLHKIYRKARAYWESMGDAEKAALTDAQLDEQFAFFDEEGIPRLKSEVDESSEPPVGSLAYAAKIIKEMGGVPVESTFDAADADEVLNREFADYLLKRMRDNNGSR
jgi:predicted transcriptional regulator